jgi:hypothetical protein
VAPVPERFAHELMSRHAWREASGERILVDAIAETYEESDVTVWRHCSR